MLSAVALLILSTLAAHHRVPQGTFHFDDGSNIVEHDPIHIEVLSLDSLVKAARNGLNRARVLPNLTLAIDWWRGGGRSGPFLVTNLLIHLMATVAVFWLLLEVQTSRSRAALSTGTIAASMIAAAVWASHPIQSQAVSYIVQRMAAMAALFSVLSVASYLRARRTRSLLPSSSWFLASALFMAAAALSKENSLVVPVLLILAEFGVVREAERFIRRPADWLILGAPLVCSILVITAFLAGIDILGASISTYEQRSFTLLERLLTQPRVIAYHFGQLLYPHPDRFSLFHDLPVSRSLLSPPSTILAILVAVAWTGAGIGLLLKRGRRTYGFYSLWVPVTLVIESSLIPLRMMFEHRMYLPTVGLAGLLAALVAALFRSDSRRLSAAVVMASVIVIALLGWATATRTAVWHSEIAILEDSVRKSPGNSTAQNNLGKLYWKLGRKREALQHYLLALKAEPTYPEAMLNAARSYSAFREDDRAELFYRRTLDLAFSWPMAHFSYGVFLLERRRLEAARAEFLTTLRLDPGYSQARLFLGYLTRQPR